MNAPQPGGSPAALLRGIVREAMSPGVFTCLAPVSLREAARIMHERGVHAIVVVGLDADGRRDLDPAAVRVLRAADLVAAVAAGDLERTAGEAARGEAVTLGSGEPLWRAAQTMADRHTTHVLVLDPRAGRPVGMLSTLDLARALAAG